MVSAKISDSFSLLAKGKLGKKYLEILLDLAKGLRVCSEVLVPNSLSLHARFPNC